MPRLEAGSWRTNLDNFVQPALVKTCPSGPPSSISVNSVIMARYQCYIPGCNVSVKASTTFGKAISELSRHFNRGDHGTGKKFDHATACQHNQSALLENMAETRPQREKKPTEKVKVATAQSPKTEDKEYLIPPKYVMPALDPKWAQEPKEIAKIYDHTKTSKITGDKIDFYKLGNQ
jgi:hypothetical protein